MITYFGEIWLTFESEDELECAYSLLKSNGYEARRFGERVCVDFTRRSFGQVQAMLEVISLAECGVSSFRMIHE